MHARDEIGAAYDARQALLEGAKDNLERMALEALEDVPHLDRVIFRVKDRASFIAKATKPKYKHLAQLEDQVAGRVITFFRDDIAVVRQRLEECFGAVEHVVKEEALTTSFGYESEHFVFVIPLHRRPAGWDAITDMPDTFEMQIRTLFMHAWAEPQHDIGYKSSDALTAEQERLSAWVAASAWGADRALNELARSAGN